MAQEIITLENLAAEIAKLRGELATWKALAIKQDRLSTAQMLAVNSGATAGKIAQIATNAADIAALQQIASSAFRVVKVAQLPASGEPYIMYLVPQTDGETLNYCNEYLWIDNAWELVGTTGAMANNGELQIIVNGVTVGTFTANQATDSTASITVPTDTSQLTNGAGYVDATALATALASKQDSLSLTQLAAVNSGITSTDVAQIGANTTAIAGKQDALTTSQLAAVNSGITSADVTQIGTNTGNIATNSAAIVSLQGSKQNTLSAAQLLAVNSGITSSLVTQIGTNQSDITTLNTALGQSLTPSADDTYSLGGASFRYANIYAVTFTGDLTGTAAKAIADEDGTSIKTGYVNVAGNQTVTGQKTFSSDTFFTSPVYQKNNTYEIGTTPASNISISRFSSDKDNKYTGCLRNAISTTGLTSVELEARNKVGSGALSPTGNATSSTFKVEVQPDGSKTLYFDGAIRNNVLPYTTNTYSLGSSSYQWSSVYAQTYYYNGVAWGLNQNNTWTGSNTFTSTITTKTNVDRAVAPTSDTTYGTIICRDKNGSAMFRMQGTIKTDLSNVWDMMMVAPNNSYITFFRYSINTATSDRELRFKADSVIPDDNSTSKLGTSTNQWSSVYAQNYYYNGTAWGLDKANEWTTDNRFLGSNLSLQNNLKEIGSSSSAGHYTIHFKDKNSVDMGYISHQTTFLRFGILNKFTNGVYDPSGTQVENYFSLYVNPDGTKSADILSKFIPGVTNLYDLGTSTNKWKTLNGINPGALGMPDASNSVNIDTTGWVTDGSAWNTIASSNLIDGYLYINYSQCSADDYIAVRLRNSSHQNPTFCISANTTAVGNHYLYVCVPVSKLFYVFLEIKTTGTLQKACIFPMLGNV